MKFNAAVAITGPLSTKWLDLTKDVADPTYAEARLFWDDSNKTYSLYNDDSSISLPLGTQTRTKVYNNTGVDITSGKCVSVTGIHASGYAYVALTDVTIPSSKSSIVGFTLSNIVSGGFGYVLMQGSLQGVNTSAFPNNTTAWLSITEPGGLQSTEPGTSSILAGTILVSSVSAGTMIVNIRGGSSSDQLAAIVKLDEGNGIGYVVEASDRTLVGNIGQSALDLSLSTGVSTTRGATGEHSVALGDDVTASGYGSFACGYKNTASGDFSFSQGYTNTSGGYSDAVYGTFNTSTGPSSAKGYRFIAGLRNTVDVTLGGIALGNGHWVSSFGTTAVGQASLQTSGGANVDTSPMLVVGNGDFNYNTGGLNVTTRSNAFVVYKSGSVVAPSLTTALIDGEATGKVLVTKEWITGQGFGDYVDLINPQSVYGIKTFYDNLYVNQFGNTGVATFGIGAVQQLYNYTTNDFTILNSSGRFTVNGSGKYLQVDATGFSVAAGSATNQRGYLLTDNLTGQQILQYPDASGTIALTTDDPRPYKVYTALISQSGSTPADVPTAIVLENTLGGTITWTRDAVGAYIGNCSITGFTTDKTVASIQHNNDATYTAGSNTVFYSFDSRTTGTCRLEAINQSGTAVDSTLKRATVEIRVYN